MKNKVRSFLKKCAFVIKEIYKADSKIMLILFVFMLFSGLNPLLNTVAITELIRLFERGTSDLSLYNHGKIFLWVAVVVLSVALNLFVTNIKYSVSEFAGYKLSHNIENIIATKFQSITQETMDCPDFLDLYRNTLDQSSYAPLGILENLFSIISSLIGLIGYLTILMRLNLYFVFALIFLTLPIYCMKYTIQLQSFNFLKDTTNRYREIQYYFSLISDKKYSQEVRLFNLFDYLKTKRKSLFSDLMSERKKILNKSIFYIFIISGIATVIISMLEFILIKNLTAGTLPLSGFFLYNTSAISFEVSLFSFIDQVVDNNRSMQFLDYLFEFLDYKTRRIIKENTKKIECFHQIAFNNVFFKYPGSEIFSLEAINLEIRAGEKICLVGENGSGKTTFIKLLLGIYEPTEGTIFLDNVDIKNYDLKEYQTLFSSTFQDFIRYFLDVKSNIAYGDVKRINDMKYLEEVANKTKSAKFIERYPKGYETKLSKEFYDYGIEPSIGQWQKLAISRAFFKKAPILLLDEPTSSLDPKAEEEIFKLFGTMGKKKTVLTISHRMYSTNLSDKIILLDKGKILEIGTHNELMEKKGKYEELYSLQANKYDLNSTKFNKQM